MAAKHPEPQTPEELERECLGTVIRVCRDIERCAEAMDATGVEIHFDFLKKQMARLDVIRKTVRQKPREF